MDEDIPPDQQGPATFNWIGAYFKHKDIQSLDLEYKTPDPARKGTVASMTPEQFAACADLNPTLRSEIHSISNFRTNLHGFMKRAIFDESTRKTWENMRVWVVYGDAAPWPAPHAAVALERMAKDMGKEDSIRTLVLPGANHFVSTISLHVESEIAPTEPKCHFCRYFGIILLRGLMHFFTA